MTALVVARQLMVSVARATDIVTRVTGVYCIVACRAAVPGEYAPEVATVMVRLSRRSHRLWGIVQTHRFRLESQGSL